MSFQRPELMDYQKICRQFIIDHPRCGIFLNMSGGKTLITLDALCELQVTGHILVVAPKTIARSVWQGEIEKFGYPIRTKSLVVNERDKNLTKAKRDALIEAIPHEPATMYFISQDLLPYLVNTLPEIPGYQQQLSIERSAQPVVAWPFSTVIIDESQGFGSPTAKRFKAMARVAPLTQRFIELSGTPTPNGLLNLWSQMYLLDQGQALAPTYSEYQSFCFDVVAKVDHRPIKWEPKDWAPQWIHQRVTHMVMSAENAEIPLPAVNYQEVRVSLDYDQAKAYRSFRRNATLELSSEDPNDPQVRVLEAKNAAVLHGKLLQYASGTIYTDDTGAYDVIHEKKLELTDYLIRQHPESSVLIAYRFRSERAQLMDYLSRAGHAVESFDGSPEMIQRWNDRQIPVMLLQPQSAGHGVNLQHGGNVLIWHTLPESMAQYKQTNSRLIRISQDATVQIYYLLTRATKDADLPALLEAKTRSQSAFLNYIKRETLDSAAEDGITLRFVEATAPEEP